MRKTVTSEMIGKRFGRLTVIRVGEPYVFRGYEQRRFVCCCDCGAEKQVRQSYLVSGHTKSCGCLARDLASQRGVHGHTSVANRQGTKTYRAWKHMKERCNNPNYRYFYRYGGRGIRYCERWESFENFLVDMGEAPEGMELDRIDNDGNYGPSNCRWATRSQQVRNRDNSRMARGERNTKSKLTEADVRAIRAEARAGSGKPSIARKYGIALSSVHNIVKRRTWGHVE